MSNSERNYNLEIKDTSNHQYAYNFDFDVMHPYMMESFQPFFSNGNLLELGCFQGDFTQRLASQFEDITCVEASEAAAIEAQRKLGDRARIINATFEDV
ncbi:MAG: SAM-dependent methyltransferase, partial [Proteobacteria bacterium]|nr:SAM-dependent methyltransferase [Pseudomonadota bacterium]